VARRVDGMVWKRDEPGLDPRARQCGATLGAIPADLSGRHLRLDEERLPEIAATIRRILPAAAAPTARRPRRPTSPAA
jgi:hypothetical protein